ncbi:hypothetical protein ACRWOO_29125 [Streptomyces sp. NEAU-PBA10]|uniref:Uncharacterized protein n=2 Tax=Streptomyces TaxID=1883 RepID=A0ABU4LJN3_9ACTN|nr:MULTISPECIES: hypothetical protein [Streptomyces]MBZ3908228.1 hypothetical protein [Streptomyces griseiscabiei]MDX2915640.1 hypothetical protein [Streptomyces griseiscabiei]
MPLSQRDFKLSMRISPMRPNSPDDEGLRSLLVHRLRGAAKAVARIPLKANLATAGLKKYSVHCEPCRSWFDLPEWGEEVTCPKCERLYALELAVFSAVPNPTD